MLADVYLETCCTFFHSYFDHLLKHGALKHVKQDLVPVNCGVEHTWRAHLGLAVNSILRV